MEDLGVRDAEPVGERGDAGDGGRQLGGRRGARILVAIRHRQNSYVSQGNQGLLTSIAVNFAVNLPARTPRRLAGRSNSHPGLATTVANFGRQQA
ncbi:hypothetical protein GCM10011578_062440 [Streptomyces fuscichromogenes]|uniref:Uncharacterized protein n=1 Tax=Streptomyces fuscichromogenes TaxID=1324013 RepID=A0A917XHW8_9ACTN|nr:hypothetical protein GCM10011578_062440 [Streptomyces fuscichromogenes]